MVQDPHREAMEQAEKIVKAIGGSRQARRPSPRVRAIDARPPSRERPRPGALSLMFAVGPLPRETHSPPPKSWAAEFAVNLGVCGRPRKSLVLAQVLGPPGSQCGNLRDYPARREIRDLFSTAWPPHYDTDPFEVFGSVLCARHPLLGHAPHPAVAIFRGLKMADLGIAALGPRPKPEKTRLAPPPDRGPTAEEVLEQAVKRAKAVAGS